MQELKKRMTVLMDSLNQAWVEEDRKAKKEERYLDATIIMGQYSVIVNQMEDAFNDAMERLGLVKKKKKGMFGGN